MSTEDPARSHKATPVQWGGTARQPRLTRAAPGLLVGPPGRSRNGAGMAGLAEPGCPGGLTFQVEPGATLQECRRLLGQFSTATSKSLNNARQLASKTSVTATATAYYCERSLVILYFWFPPSNLSRHLSSNRSHSRYLDRCLTCLQSPHSLATDNDTRRILCDFRPNRRSHP